MLQTELWLDFSINFLIVGNLAGFFLSAVLIFRPHWLKPLSHTLNRRLDAPELNRAIQIDPWFYRYRWLSGGLIFFGALYVLIYFTALIERQPAMNGLVQHWQLPPALVDTFFDAWVLLILMGASWALLTSLFIMLRPSLLREFEQNANRWIVLSPPMRPHSRGSLDEFALRNAQSMGFLLLLGSLYAWVLLIYFRP